jgi:hypothetical protein
VISNIYDLELQGYDQVEMEPVQEERIEEKLAASGREEKVIGTESKDRKKRNRGRRDRKRGQGNEDFSLS